MSDELISRLRDRSISIAAKDRDWPTFWQSLTAQETAAALQAAPDVALPWSQIGKYWRRKNRALDGLCLDDDDAVGAVAHADGSAHWYIPNSDHRGNAPTLAEGIRLNPRS